MNKILVPVIVVAGVITACGASHHAAAPAPSHGASVVTAPVPASPAGPFTVKTDLCGKFPASMHQVDGKYGMTVTVKNISRTAYTVSVSGVFLNGSTVDTTDTSDTSAVLAPGQSQKLSIGNLTSSGEPGNLRDTCKPVDYAVQTASGGFVNGPYQGGWKVP